MIALLPSHVADLQLRVAEQLAEMKLPAVLAPGVLSYAMWDLAMNAAMADLDDWLPVVRASRSLTADRMADYLSALTAGGPLVRLDARAPEEDRVSEKDRTRGVEPRVSKVGNERSRAVGG
jgi:hypothetical protein